MGSLLTYERLHADRAGESHSARLDISLSTHHFAPPAPPFGVSELSPVSRSGFLRMPAGFAGHLHPSPLHRWIFFLGGEMAFQASDGERQRHAPGNALLLEDTTGKEHRSRLLGGGAQQLRFCVPDSAQHCTRIFQRGGLHG